MKISLEQYQEKLRKWQNKQLSETEGSIRLFYRKLLKDIISELGIIYSKFENDGQLTYVDMTKYNRLNKFIDSLIDHINLTSKTTRKSIESLLSENYTHSYYWMGWAVETSTLAQVGYTALGLDIIDAAINNPIKGLTLTETLEKNRKDIVYKIKQNVTQGLVKGYTYKQMANDLKTVLDNDYKKAVRIVRTETHRVNEQATLESMQRANSKGVISVKTWHSSKDERVRKGSKSNKANHRKLDGQTVGINEMFDLGNGEKGIGPGNTGYAHHDIGCRCFLVYDVVAIEKRTNEDLANIAFEDWKKTLKGRI